MVLSWLGAGDIVDNAVAGAHYGYALMWALVIAFITRIVLVSIIARYPIYNLHGDTILGGYYRVNKFYPIVLGASGVLMGFFYNTYMIRGAGEALFNITHVGSPFFWSIIAVIAGVAITGRSFYKHVEITEKVILIVMTFALIVSALWVGPNPKGIIAGTIGFDLPESVGAIAAITIALSLIGTVAGSITNLMYPYFLEERGWNKPQFRKLQMYDIVFSCVMVIILDLAVWTLGAEVLHPKGIEIKGISDLARMLGDVVGPAGTYLIYLGVLCATFSSLIAFNIGFPKMMADALNVTYKNRPEIYKDQPQKDPWYKVSYVIIAILPLIFSLPGMPGFIYMTVLVNAWALVLLPIIAIGLLIVVNKKENLGENTASKWENIIMIFLLIMVMWGVLNMIKGYF